MSIKYFFQKLLGRVLDKPLFPEGKAVGYSLVRSEIGNCQLSKDSRVYPPFFLHKVELGDFSYIAKNANIINCSIGKFCSIGPNFCCGLGIHPTNGISTSPMFYSTRKQNGISLCQENKIRESQKTIIGNDVFIGANVTILDGLCIGDGAVIGAGAVVTNDIPPYAIATGVPATVTRYRFEQEVIDRLLDRRWWDKGMDEWKRIVDDFWNVQGFLSKE